MIRGYKKFDGQITWTVWYKIPLTLDKSWIINVEAIRYES